MSLEQRRQDLVEYLNTFKGNESEIKIQLKTGKWSNAHIMHEKAIVETWLEEREKDKEEQKQKRLLVTAIVASLAAVISAVAAWMGAYQQKLESRAQLRPYVLIKLANNAMRWNKKNGLPFLPYEGPQFVTLPYQLENVGSTPALKIKKGYSSYLVDNSEKATLIQSFKDTGDKTDALLPSQASAIHMDQINISGLDSSKFDKRIQVDLEITYKGFSEVDHRVSYSKANLILIPDKMDNGEIGFYVSQPSLDFGFENKK